MARTVLKIAAAVLVLGLAGCSSGGFQPSGSDSQAVTSVEEVEQRDALEAYADIERAQVEAFLETAPEMYSDVRVETIFPGGIAFIYTYWAQVDPVAAADGLEVMTPTLQTLCDTAVFPAMKSTGIEGAMYVRYQYLNADGTEIWTKDFQSS